MAIHKQVQPVSIPDCLHALKARSVSWDFATVLCARSAGDDITGVRLEHSFCSRPLEIMADHRVELVYKLRKRLGKGGPYGT